MTALEPRIAFVFVHSYSSAAQNWADVMVGTDAAPGRLPAALSHAEALGVPVVADDREDAQNRALYERHGVQNLGTALRTQDEVRSALAHAGSARVLFVTSPDHLPRVVRDVMAAGGTLSLFAAAATAFSKAGADRKSVV